MKYFLIYWLGKFSKKYRLYYHKKHNGRYPWGLMNYINDSPPLVRTPIDVMLEMLD